MSDENESKKVNRDSLSLEERKVLALEKIATQLELFNEEVFFGNYLGLPIRRVD